MSDKVENIDNVITVIDEYANHIHSVRNSLLKNMEMIVCNWSQICTKESNRYKQCFHLCK